MIYLEFEFCKSALVLALPTRREGCPKGGVGYLNKFSKLIELFDFNISTFYYLLQLTTTAFPFALRTVPCTLRPVQFLPFLFYLCILITPTNE